MQRKIEWQGVDDLGLGEAVYGNYCRMWRAVGAIGPPEGVFQVEQRPDMLLVRSRMTQRVPHMVLSPVAAAGQAAAWAGGLVRELGSGPTSIMVDIPPGDEEGELVKALRVEGFVQSSRQQVSMARRIDPALAAWHDAEITVARSQHELEEARALMARIFGLPSVVFAFYTPPDVVETFVLRRRGAAVGAACLCPVGGTAGIYSVGVLPSERGNGYARNLTRQALASAAADGLDLAVLSCERHLVPFYQQLGFVVCWEKVSYWLEAWWR